MKLTTILITGSNGLVGNYLKEIINERNMDVFYNIVYTDRSIVNLENAKHVLDYFNRIKPDIVIHLAAVVGGLYYNLKNNHDIFMSNVNINSNILKACDLYNISRLINVLSTCIFPNNYNQEENQVSLRSNDIHKGEPHPSNIGYSYAKRLLEIGSRLLVDKKDDFSVVNLIPTNLYGKYDNYNLEKAHVIPALIHKFYKAKQNDTNVEILGHGTAKRQFLYAKDFADIILKFIDYKLDNKCINCIISPPKKDELSIANVIGKISGRFMFENPILYNKDNQGQMKKSCDDNELSIYFNYNFTSLDTGLLITIDYFINNYETCRI
jgi:GDP-L-fucose synthase